jgi:hypothetical protein
MLELLAEWTAAIQALPYAGLLSVAAIAVLVVGTKTGAFYTSPAGIKAAAESEDNWEAFANAAGQALSNSVFFGLIAFLAVVWDRWWITGPLALLFLVMAIPTLLQDVVVVVTSIPILFMKPGSIIPVAGGTLVRLTGDVVFLVYLGVVSTSLFT